MGRDIFTHDFPPSSWTVDGIAQTLREEPEVFPLPQYQASSVWKTLHDDDLAGPVVEDILDQARAEKGKDVPPLSASLYLDYARTGTRTRYQEVERKRTRRLGRYALAECFGREGEYLDDILDYAWAACEQTTWVLPAHVGWNEQQELDGLPSVVEDSDRHVALRSAALARQLAEIDYVLGDQLHPALRERIRHEVDRRVLTPYESRDDLPWLVPPANNWNAVCNTGVVISALHLLDSPERQAQIVAKAARSLGDYLADFDHDGCTAEGVHYWNYGMRHYAALAAHLETRTDGAYSLLSPPIMESIARYPLKVELSPGRFISFSDTVEDEKVDPFTACWLGRRLDIPGLAARGLQEFKTETASRSFGDTLRTLREVRRIPIDWEIPTPPKRIHFTGYDWWLSRQDPNDSNGAVVASKGGHNAESHNHNDLGTFLFHSHGESLLTDLGRPVYDADFFKFDGPRWEYLTTRSLGHNVPYVNGTEQAPGNECRAEVLDRSDGENSDSFALDLTRAYPEVAGLSNLSRTVTLDRPAGRLTVDDEASFEKEENEFVEVLVSYAPMAQTDTGVAVSGEEERAVVVSDPLPDEIEVERIDNAVRGNDVWRALISYHPHERLEVELGVTAE